MDNLLQMALAHANPGVEFHFPGSSQEFPGDARGDELSMQLVILGVLLVVSIMAFNTAVLTLPLAIGEALMPLSHSMYCVQARMSLSIMAFNTAVLTLSLAIGKALMPHVHSMYCVQARMSEQVTL